ncbi:MAG: hypothetical protein WDN31_07600 [Hyphomicrobium sp.]
MGVRPGCGNAADILAAAAAQPTLICAKVILLSPGRLLVGRSVLLGLRFLALRLVGGSTFFSITVTEPPAFSIAARAVPEA